MLSACVSLPSRVSSTELELMKTPVDSTSETECRFRRVSLEYMLYEQKFLRATERATLALKDHVTSTELELDIRIRSELVWRARISISRAHT